MLSGRHVPVPSTRVPTILLVDDADVVRKSAARCLRRKGYVVIEAAAAAEALALLAENGDKIDLLLTDLVLPAMGGAELVEEARRRQPSVGIAYMTGHLGVSARCETPLDQNAPVLIKPFTPSLLEERVREALARAGWEMNGTTFGAH
jgi:two-component system cell cycle sensor histidine kinase/response regulator CckA